MSKDNVLDQMANELRQALLAKGLDPTTPPSSTNPPHAAAFAEYQRRGGTAYADADAMMAALVNRVGELHREAMSHAG